MGIDANAQIGAKVRCAGQVANEAGLRYAQILAGTFALAALACSALSAQSSSNPVNPDKPYLLPEANRLPDVNQQMEMREQQNKAQNYAAANAERKKQIAGDTTRLLKLATDLKAELGNTSKDTLSLNVIRRADEIERLAHNVKEKMKLTVGTN